MLKTAKIIVPFYIWLLAFAAGVGVAVASLSYSPQGRINILWVWLLWAALPLLGSVVSLMFAAFGSARPWLFQWRGFYWQNKQWPNKPLTWYPTRKQRLEMLWLLQMVWCLLALGMLLGYWVLLLFSDLAFGWSSTLVQNASVTATAVEWLAAPWRALWPAAVPTADMVAATHFQRIAPSAAKPALAAQWWRFLMASLIFYNLLPRTLLALVFYGCWRWGSHSGLQVRSPAPSASESVVAKNTIIEGSLAEWHDAPRLSWELDDPAAAASFGLNGWTEDEQRLARILAQQPPRLLWQVNATRSPVAELSDLMTNARAAGVSAQALWARQNKDTDPERHLLSWRAFAHQHQLIWIVDD